MADKNTWTDDAAKRIVRAVKKSERTPTPIVPVASTYRPTGGGLTLAQINTNGSDGTVNKYSWTALAPNGDIWAPNSDWGSGDKDASEGYLVESTGFADVPWGTPIEVEPANSDSGFYWVFTYQGSVVPVTINSFVPGGEGTATIAGSPQTVKFMDYSNGTVNAGTSAVLSYCAGQPGSPGHFVIIQ